MAIPNFTHWAYYPNSQCPPAVSMQQCLAAQSQISPLEQLLYILYTIKGAIGYHGEDFSMRQVNLQKSNSLYFQRKNLDRRGPSIVGSEATNSDQTFPQLMLGAPLVRNLDLSLLWASTPFLFFIITAVGPTHQEITFTKLSNSNGASQGFQSLYQGHCSRLADQLHSKPHFLVRFQQFYN